MSAKTCWRSTVSLLIVRHLVTVLYACHYCPALLSVSPPTHTPTLHIPTPLLACSGHRIGPPVSSRQDHSPVVLIIQEGSNPESSRSLRDGDCWCTDSKRSFRVGATWHQSDSPHCTGPKHLVALLWNQPVPAADLLR